MRTIFLMLCVAGILVGQDQSQEASANADAAIRESFKFVLVRAAVTDKSGHIIKGLEPGDFRLNDNGRPQTITAEVASHPVSVVVAVESTADLERILPEVKKLSSAFEAFLVGETGELALIGFDAHVRTLADFTSDSDTIDAAFKSLKPAGGSGNVSEAAMAGINMLRNRPATRQPVLILISEGRGKGSATEVREVLTAAEFGNIIIYSMNISQLLTSLTSQVQPPRPNPIPPEARPLVGGILLTPTTDSQMQMGNWIPGLKAGFVGTKGLFLPNPLDIYTKYTGGREFSFNGQTAGEVVSQIGEELHGQYLLTYIPSTQEQAGFHQIQVTVQQPDLTVHTRDGYWLAAKPE
jgi:VWFA-related protein